MFEETKFMSIKDKELVLKAWETFLKKGMQEQHFTKRLYEHLISHCSLIAHFNRRGFYSHYFTSPSMTANFISQFDHDKGYRATEYGDDYWIRGEYRDINMAMCDVLEKYKEKIYDKLQTKEFKDDMAVVTGLMDKHGILNVEAVEGGYRFS